MANCAIVGINWGDEGKGRMVDYLAAEYDVVIRYQGGNNAGHTIVNHMGEFKLNLIPSGIFRPQTVNLLGPGMVVDTNHLCGELASLRQRGVTITKENFRISDRAVVALSLHANEDRLEEARLGKGSFGSTQRGIAPAYADRAYKKALRMGDLLRPEALKDALARLVDWKNAVYAKGYGCPPYSYGDILADLQARAEELAPHIVDAAALLQGAKAEGKRILFEAQLGALRDLDYGIYPYTSSSSPLAAYAPVGCGLPSLTVDRVMGVVKAYSTCVGAGPFVGELTDETGEEIRRVGKEYGAATGRPRRVAWMDLVASRYGVMMQGATELALTKLDVLSGFENIPLCVGYRLDGEVIRSFPYPHDLTRCEPVFEILPGWQTDISHARRYEDLPKEARGYVERVEAELACPIPYLSVGPSREALIIREKNHGR